MKFIPWRIGTYLGLRPRKVEELLESKNPLYIYDSAEFYLDFNHFQQIHCEELKLPDIFYSFPKEELLKKCRQIEIIKCKNARFIKIEGFDSIIVKHRILSKLSYLKSYLNPKVSNVHPALSIDCYPPSTLLKGKTLSLATMGAQTAYGEWVTNLIPRIAIAEYFGYKLDDFDNIIINIDGKKWQEELITLLQIPKTKICPVYEGVSYKIEELFAPSYSPHSMLGYQYIQERLVKPYTRKVQSPQRRVYLSRKNDKRLKISNEHELTMLLSKYSFEAIDITKISIEEQIILMDNVEILISCQGSGLTNVLFMKPGTKAIEIHNIEEPNPHFNIYGVFKNISYFNFMAKPIDTVTGGCVELYCDLQKMILLLNKIGIETID